MKKLILLIFCILLANIALAEDTVLGTFQKGENINLPQVANSTYCNITSIRSPNSSTISWSTGLERVLSSLKTLQIS